MFRISDGGERTYINIAQKQVLAEEENGNSRTSKSWLKTQFLRWHDNLISRGSSALFVGTAALLPFPRLYCSQQVLFIHCSISWFTKWRIRQGAWGNSRCAVPSSHWWHTLHNSRIKHASSLSLQKLPRPLRGFSTEAVQGKWISSPPRQRLDTYKRQAELGKHRTWTRLAYLEDTTVPKSCWDFLQT